MRYRESQGLALAFLFFGFVNARHNAGLKGGSWCLQVGQARQQIGQRKLVQMRQEYFEGPIQNTAQAAIAGQQTPINCIEEDNQGNLWLAAGNTALIRSAYPVLQLHPAYPETFFETTHALCVSADGSFWAGTDMAVMKYWLKGKSYSSKKYPVAGLGIKTDITSLYEDSYHNIWVGTMGNGIHVLDAATGHTRQLTEALPSGSILSITGNGNASKEQVAAILSRLLQFDHQYLLLDATDALAVAVCHHFQNKTPQSSIKKVSGWKEYLLQNPERIHSKKKP